MCKMCFFSLRVFRLCTNLQKYLKTTMDLEQNKNIQFNYSQLLSKLVINKKKKILLNYEFIIFRLFLINYIINYK